MKLLKLKDRYKSTKIVGSINKYIHGNMTQGELRNLPVYMVDETEMFNDKTSKNKTKKVSKKSSSEVKKDDVIKDDVIKGDFEKEDENKED